LREETSYDRITRLVVLYAAGLVLDYDKACISGRYRCSSGSGTVLGAVR